MKGLYAFRRSNLGSTKPAIHHCGHVVNGWRCSRKQSRGARHAADRRRRRRRRGQRRQDARLGGEGHQLSGQHDASACLRIAANELCFECSRCHHHPAASRLLCLFPAVCPSSVSRHAACQRLAAVACWLPAAAMYSLYHRCTTVPCTRCNCSIVETFRSLCH
jgi:hypothetical protein